MTSPVSIVRNVPLNRDALAPLLRTQLEILAEASERGAVAMAARLPGNSRITVPVRLSVSYPAPRKRDFGLTIAGRDTPALYPRFTGHIDIAQTGAAATSLTLSGAYQVPFGALGRVIDATAARGVAPHGLEDLIDRLIADLLAAVAHRSDVAYRSGRGSAGAVTGLAAAESGQQQLTAAMYGSKLGIKGADGQPHDILIPTNFVVKAGVPVTLTVVNYDERPHNIFQPDLGLNLVMKGGIEQPDKSVKPVTTDLHFTATKKGVYRWYCTLPCDEKHGAWDMKTSANGPDQDGFMAGYIVVQ